MATRGSGSGGAPGRASPAPAGACKSGAGKGRLCQGRGERGRYHWLFLAGTPLPHTARSGSVCWQGPAATPSTMVRNVDDFDFCLPSHAQGVLEGLQRLRTNPKLADVTLVAGGREFPCHRGVLALCSHYFHAMFSGDFAESIAARVELKEVDPGALEMLLDFAYTGKVTINQGNVEGLMRTSSQLHFPTIQKVCSRYLRQQMDATNCLGICEFGESHGCPEVSSKAWSFLQENFEAVSLQEEFLQLSKERLATYLSNDQLQVQEEQSLAEAVLRWVRHDPGPRAQFLPELLELAHLVSLPDQYLQNLLATEPLVRDSDASKALVARSRAMVCTPCPKSHALSQGGRLSTEPDGPAPASVRGRAMPVPRRTP